MPEGDEGAENGNRGNGKGGLKGKETEEMDKSFFFWVLGQNFPSLCSRLPTKSMFGAQEVDDIHFCRSAMSGGDASLTWTERCGTRTFCKKKTDDAVSLSSVLSCWKFAS